MVTRPAPSRSLRARPGRSAAPRAGGPGGFTFLEILVVMAMLAVLAGLGLGLMQNLAGATRLMQARAIVLETAFACKGSSNGGTKATFVLREGQTENGPRIFAEAYAARPVLTADFETLDVVSQGYPVKVNGGAKVDPDVSQGYVGRAVRLERGGWLELPAQSAFAMTEGLEVDLRVRTDGGGAAMTVLRGADPDDDKSAVYELQLVRSGDSSAYDVKLRLLLRLRPEAASTGVIQEFTTVGAPVRADGTWNRIQARFDGHDASIRVNGLERVPKAAPAKAPKPGTPPAPGGPGAAATDAVKRLVMPASGTVRLTISGPDRPFQGWMDALVLGGMFRSSDFTRELFPNLSVPSPKLPLRAEYVNGRLDPLTHRAPIVIRLADASQPDEPAWIITLGLDGEITSALAAPGKAAP